MSNLKKAFYYFKRNGIIDTVYAAFERISERKEGPYKKVSVSESELEAQKKWSSDKDILLSVVVPTYRTDRVYLCELIDSVLEQSYPVWELIFADATEDDSVENIVKKYNDERIRYFKLEKNKGISENTNEGMTRANGEYIGLLDHDDILEPNALYEMIFEIDRAKKSNKKPMLLYSDEDKCNSDRSEFYEPNIKEKFNLDLLLSNNYICHFLVMESGLIKNLGLRREYDGAQDYDLVLRAAAKLMEDETCIIHVPKVLYHWRCHAASTAENPMSKMYAYDAGLRALKAFADLKGYDAKAVHLKNLGFYALKYKGDIFKSRSDLGAVGGRLQKRGKIVGGRMSSGGKIYYEGLPVRYTGYMHRAALSQDAYAVDIRCIKVNPSCIKIFEDITKVEYTEDDEGLFDYTILQKDADIVRMSIEFGRQLKSKGFRILYDPGIMRKIGKRAARRKIS